MNETSPHKGLRESTGSMFIKVMEHDEANKPEPYIQQTKEKHNKCFSGLPRKENESSTPTINFAGVHGYPGFALD